MVTLLCNVIQQLLIFISKITYNYNSSNVLSSNVFAAIFSHITFVHQKGYLNWRRPALLFWHNHGQNHLLDSTQKSMGRNTAPCNKSLLYFLLQTAPAADTMSCLAQHPPSTILKAISELLLQPKSFAVFWTWSYPQSLSYFVLNTSSRTHR